MTEEKPPEVRIIALSDVVEHVEPAKKAPKTPAIMPHTARARAAAIAKIKARKA